MVAQPAGVSAQRSLGTKDEHLLCTADGLVRDFGTQTICVPWQVSAAPRLSR